jgi:membrane protease YdiL (CAAX protease family)
MIIPNETSRHAESSPAVTQPSLGRPLVLHLLPGALTTAGHLILAPVLMARGYPALLALLLAMLFLLVPFELAYLLQQARAVNGSFDLRGIVLNRQPLAGPIGEELYFRGYLSAALAYVTWWKRNLYLAMAAHRALNAIVWAITFSGLLR